MAAEKSNPLAAIIVTGITSGREGLRDLLGRMFKWRVRLGWWLVAFAPLLLYALLVVSMLVMVWAAAIVFWFKPATPARAGHPLS